MGRGGFMSVDESDMWMGKLTYILQIDLEPPRV